MSTTTTPVSSTYSEFGAFPSEPENRFRAVQGHVSFDAASDLQPWAYVTGSLQIGFNGSVVVIPLDVDVEDVFEVTKAKDDLEFLRAQVNAYVDAAISALDGE